MFYRQIANSAFFEVDTIIIGNAKIKRRPNIQTMITCERCGNVMPNSSLLCLVCGTLSVFSKPDIHTPTRNEPGSVPFPIPGDRQEEYEQRIYNPQPGYAPFADEKLYNPSSAPHPTLTSHIATTPINPDTPSIKKGALFVEVALNLCLGLFGIGWLVAGETITGLVLLACSIILYWPILLIGFFLNFLFSIGPGLYGLILLAISVMSLNVILLRKTIMR